MVGPSFEVVGADWLVESAAEAAAAAVVDPKAFEVLVPSFRH